MEGRFKYEKLAYYPRMRDEDVAVWERYIAEHPDVFETCDYDVLVGDGATPDPTMPKEWQDHHVLLTQKRIDVVAYAGTTTYIIEIKPIADARCLGQILTYLTLYRAAYPSVKGTIPMVICGAVEREMQQMFDAHGIVVTVA